MRSPQRLIGLMMQQCKFKKPKFAPLWRQACMRYAFSKSVVHPNLGPGPTVDGQNLASFLIRMRRTKLSAMEPPLHPDLNIGFSTHVPNPPPNGQNLASSNCPRATVSTLKSGVRGAASRVWIPLTTLRASRGCQWELARFCPSTVGSGSKFGWTTDFEKAFPL